MSLLLEVLFQQVQFPLCFFLQVCHFQIRTFINQPFEAGLVVGNTIVEIQFNALVCDSLNPQTPVVSLLEQVPNIGTMAFDVFGSFSSGHLS
ncbi:hypothetical protein IQ268_28215 [Oculatella sp. LEGE 06141]|uniref:hypothetical protein n=1 Tax=Oculatella sp. LEGE 06141 TaxID=1828648 RepID=UPI00187E60C7|nr:hypothetical protein [Oculatella sp. LEGE 06141]MBE9182438.1 hypothetical protein [Oculatella sp. LEGE 06141]